MDLDNTGGPLPSLVHLGIKMWIFAKKNQVLMAKNKGYQNFTLNLGLPNPPLSDLENIQKT